MSAYYNDCNRPEFYSPLTVMLAVVVCMVDEHCLIAELSSVLSNNER